MKKYLGIIGDPIQHTLSPAMHNAALAKQGMEFTYLPFQVATEELAQALQGMKALGFVGFNVTIPHKVAILPYLDELSKEAELIGAVNTVHLQNGRWIGHNTDGIGFLHSLLVEGGVEPAGAKVLLLGAGGAARAVAVQLGLAGAGEIVIANRTAGKALELAGELAQKISAVTGKDVANARTMVGGETGWTAGMMATCETRSADETMATCGIRSTDTTLPRSTILPNGNAMQNVIQDGGPIYRGIGFDPQVLRNEVSNAQIIVNATPLGMAAYSDEDLPIEPDWLRPDQVVVDLVYRPQETPLIKMARKAGARAVTGDGMLLYQGAEAYRLWTGVEPPIAVMREALLNGLLGCQVGIRPYEPHDEAEWVNCWGQVVVTSHAWTLIRQTKPHYLQPAVELVAVVGGRIAGFIDIEISPQEYGEVDVPYGFVWEFGVLKEYRGAGIARKMIEAAAAELSKIGIKRMEFWSVDPDSQQFYQHMGMVEIGRHYQLFVQPDKAIAEFFQPGKFQPWFLYGSCNLADYVTVEGQYKVKQKEPEEPHVCIGYNYFF